MEAIEKENKVELFKKLEKGRQFKFTAEELFEVAKRYIEHNKTQTFTKKIYDQKNGKVEEMELPRPITVEGFCLFSFVSKQTFYNIVNDRDGKYDKDLIDVCTYVHLFIREYQVSGGLLNELNPLLVSKLNGINDTVNVQSTVTINALPVMLGGNVIDLTAIDYSIVNDPLELSEVID